MTPETAARMRVLLEAFCAALTGLFPWSRRLKQAFASAFAWLDQVTIVAAPVVVLVAPVVVPVVAAPRIRGPRSCGKRQARRQVVAGVAQDVGFMPGNPARPSAVQGIPAWSMRAAVIPERALFAKS